MGMKIFYFTPFFHPSSEAAAIRSFWFSKVLIEAGNKVYILHNGITFIKLANNKKSSLQRLVLEVLVGIELFLRILFSRGYQRCILSSPPFITCLIGMTAAYLKKIPIYFDARDLYPQSYVELEVISKDSPLYKMIVKMTQFYYKKIFCIITVNNVLKNEIISLGAPTDRVKVIMNGYDPQIFKPGLKEEKFLKFSVIFHGTLGKVQNINTLIKLAKSLEMEEDIEFLVAGEGPRSQEILDAKSNNIKFLGKLSQDEIALLLRKCHLGISFRTDNKIGKEALPVKVFEYIGCGLPVMITPVSEVTSFLDQNAFGKSFENSQIIQMKNHLLELKKSQKINSPPSKDLSREFQAKLILEIEKELNK